jgi:hypothetical protein
MLTPQSHKVPCQRLRAVWRWLLGDDDRLWRLRIIAVSGAEEVMD